jgi:hypothetical protein
MRLAYLIVGASVCFGLAVVGCKPTSPSAGGGQGVSVPAGWKVFTPTEGDFSVAVPADPSVARSQDEKTQKVRLYVFRKGEAGLNVMLYSERTGSAAQMDKPEEIRADPAVGAGSVREIALGEMRGLEFRRKDPQDGDCVHRVYRSPDGSRAVALRVAKPQALTDAEVRAFLESFQFVR